MEFGEGIIWNNKWTYYIVLSSAAVYFIIYIKTYLYQEKILNGKKINFVDTQYVLYVDTNAYKNTSIPIFRDTLLKYKLEGPLQFEIEIYEIQTNVFMSQKKLFM